MIRSGKIQVVAAILATILGCKPSDGSNVQPPAAPNPATAGNSAAPFATPNGAVGTQPGASPATAGNPASPATTPNGATGTQAVSTPGAKYIPQGAKFNGACLTSTNGQPLTCVEDWFTSFRGPCPATSKTIPAHTQDNPTSQPLSVSTQWVNGCPTVGIQIGCLGKNSSTDTVFAQIVWMYAAYSQVVGSQPVCSTGEQQGTYP